VDLLRKISNYVAQYDAPLSAVILSNYVKMMSTSVQIGVIDMVLKHVMIMGSCIMARPDLITGPGIIYWNHL